MKENELKPCPFCGSTEILISKDYDSHPYIAQYFAECDTCQAGFIHSSEMTRQGAIEQWNKRK